MDFETPENLAHAGEVIRKVRADLARTRNQLLSGSGSRTVELIGQAYEYAERDDHEKQRVTALRVTQKLAEALDAAESAAKAQAGQIVLAKQAMEEHDAKLRANRATGARLRG